MTIWFTSDLHFNHRGIIDYCHRPYPDVGAMNEAMIANWNSVVQPQDTIYVLGDFAFGQDVGSPFARLRGHKHLVIGNHDERNPRVLKLPWVSKSSLLKVRWEGHRFICCHYPMETWENAQRGYLHLHGHSHGTLKRKIPHRFDVGVDAVGMQIPVSAEMLVKLAAQQTFDAQDHHGD